jgi:hypothetical protein
MLSVMHRCEAGYGIARVEQDFLRESAKFSGHCQGKNEDRILLATMQALRSQQV